MPYHHDHKLGGKRYVKDAIFGFNDGLVSTFALVSGIAGAGFENYMVAFVGFISAIAGALSMAFGTYISTKSQIEVYSGEIKRELRNIEEKPNVEKDEIKNLFKQFGFKGKQLKMVVDKITADKATWLSLIAHEELGISGSEFKNPTTAAIIIFVIFVLAAIVPIYPYLVLATNQALFVSVASGIIFLFFIGVVKSKITRKNWFESGLEMTAIGLVAALAVYYLGSIIGVYI